MHRLRAKVLGVQLHGEKQLQCSSKEVKASESKGVRYQGKTRVLSILAEVLLDAAGCCTKQRVGKISETNLLGCRMEVVLQLRLWSSSSSCMIRRCSYFGGLYGESHICCLVNAANASCLPDILIFEGILNLCRTVESWLSQPCLQGEKPPHPLLQSLGSSFFHWLDFSWIFHSSGGFFSFSFFNKYCNFYQSLYYRRLSACPETSTSPPPRFKHGVASITTCLP